MQYRRTYLAFFFVAQIIFVVNAHPASIKGRVWLNNYPTPGIKIEVKDLETGKIIAVGATKNYSGSDSGSYEISGLPQNKKLRITATHMLFQNQPTSQDILLKNDGVSEHNLMLNITVPDSTSSIFERAEQFTKMAQAIPLPQLTIEYPKSGQSGWDGTVSGKVSGTLPENPVVVLYFKTDKVYEQGRKSISEPGTWKFTTTYPTDGVKHTVFAVVLDGNGVLYSATGYLYVEK